jgi:hypothetical protein
MARETGERSGTMKEKTYHEVLEEMERKNSSQYEILLELGEICFSMIERMNREQVRTVRETEVTLNGKNYQITIEERSPWNT